MGLLYPLATSFGLDAPSSNNVQLAGVYQTSKLLILKHLHLNIHVGR